jgi:uncharacterized membrane protein
LSRAANVATVNSGGYTFTNFDGPNSGNAAGAGTTINGIANSGATVGFSADNNGNFTNFVRNPDGIFTTLTSLNNGTAGMANGINRAGDVVGQLNGNAVVLPHGGSPQTPALPQNAGSTAFGINDNGNILGQFTIDGAMPGFFVANSAGGNFVRIDAPTGPDTVNAQSVNNHGLGVGFYVGTDGQDHGFMANISQAHNGQLTGTPIADPPIPNVPGEPGATFVFSQILGVNDNGIAVGYYGDSTTSQHGFFYNLNTGQYTFLDDPSEQFNNGVEVTQITGINNADDISGFYSDANGVFHGFLACPVGSACPASTPAAVPEPASLLLAGFGFAAVGLGCWRRRRILA